MQLEHIEENFNQSYKQDQSIKVVKVGNFSYQNIRHSLRPYYSICFIQKIAYTRP